MNVGTRLIMAFLAVALLVAVLGVFAIRQRQETVETAAAIEASQIAETMATSLTYSAGDSTTPARLAKVLGLLRGDQQRAMAVVDADGDIVAAAPRDATGLFDAAALDRVAAVVRTGRPAAFTDPEEGTDAMRLAAAPLDQDLASFEGAIVIEYTPLYRELTRSGLRASRTIFGAGLAFIAIALALGVAMARGLGSSMRQLDRAVRRMSGGDEDVRVEIKSRDEIGRLANSFNAMAESLKASRVEVLESKTSLESILQSAGEGICVLDAAGDVEFVNPAVERMSGYASDDIVGRGLHRTLHDAHAGDGPRDDCPICRPPRKGGDPRMTTEQFRRKDGSTFLAQVVSTPIFQDGAATGGVVTFWDVTEIKRAEEAVRDQAALLELAPNSIIVRSLDSKILYWNKGAEDQYGWSRDEAIGRMAHELLRTEAPDARGAIDKALLGSGRWEGEVVHYRRDGSKVVVDSKQALQTDRNGEPKAIMEINIDITERKRLEDQLTHQALHDSLTGLGNRALLADRVDHALVRARRRRATLALLFLDLDDFKTVNDSLGHDAGDDLLRLAADRLSACLRADDTAVRLGGDEFAILLEDIEGDLEAATISERILQSLEAPFLIKGKELSARASIGIALAEPDSPVTTDDLLRNADVAMYVAKASGKATYRHFEPNMHRAAMRRLELRAGLQRGIDRNEFVLHYQPIFDMRRGALVGVEALVRWRHPERGIVLPGDFIPLAEETGLIVPIGRHVMAEAVATAADWARRFGPNPNFRVSVNLSAISLRSHSLVGEIADVLDDVDFDPTNIVLEVTESIFGEGSGGPLTTLEALKDMGMRLALDDFGIEYSSFGRLRDLPIDIIKIDKSFTQAVSAGARERAFADAIIQVGRALRLEVIAEGIETAGQRARLLEMGCDLGQGFILGRPMDGADIERLLDPTTPTGIVVPGP